MNKTIAKIFYKNKFIKVRVIFENKTAREFYTIPLDDVVTLKKEELVFNVNHENLILENGIPTYTYNYLSTEPCNLYDIEEDLIIYKPSKSYLAIYSSVLQKLFKDFNKGDNLDIKTLLPLIFNLIVGGGVYYLLNKVLQIIIVRIEELKTLLELITGVSNG